MPDAIEMTSPREEGLLGEAIALVSATDGMTDLHPRAVKLLADVQQAAGNAFLAWKLLIPAITPGSLAGEADAIDTELVARLGFDPLDLRIQKPTSGAFADSLNYASGDAATEANQATTDAGDTIRNIGDGLLRWVRYLGIALFVLLLAYAAVEAARFAKEAKA